MGFHQINQFSLGELTALILSRIQQQEMPFHLFLFIFASLRIDLKCTLHRFCKFIIKFIPKYLIFFVGTVIGALCTVTFSNSLLFVYMKLLIIVC